MDFEYRPITLWPGPMTKGRKRAKFRAGYQDTLGLLDRELRHLGARKIVLQVALTPGEIRLDGRPRSGSRPAHPGIILSFESKLGPLSYPCDRFDLWEDNLRAVVLSLQALRSVDRYGVTRRAEQYRGWAQLPGPGSMDRGDAVAVLAAYYHGPIHDQEALGNAYRAAVLATHPDRGGDAEDFKRVQEAKEVLEKAL